MRTILILSVSLATAALLIAGCGGDDDTSSSADFEVVATTSIAADLASNVVGDSAVVVELLPANADPHDFEPSPSDAEALMGADLIVRSGGDLDIWLDDLVDSSGTDAPVLDLIESTETIEGGHSHEEEGHAEGEKELAEAEVHAEDEHSKGETAHAHEGEDPHWWQNPVNAISAVEAIRSELVAMDANAASEFDANADAYIERLEALDTSIEACVNQLPASDKKLVTSHDALGYFAERYGFEVIGAAIPALTTQAQPSAGETAELVDLIREHDIAAVFPEAGVSASLEQAIAEEAGARIGPQLWADTLGPEGSGGESYTGAMATNTINIVDALSEGEADCADLEKLIGQE